MSVWQTLSQSQIACTRFPVMHCTLARPDQCVQRARVVLVTKTDGPQVSPQVEEMWAAPLSCVSWDSDAERKAKPSPLRQTAGCSVESLDGTGIALHGGSNVCLSHSHAAPWLLHLGGSFQQAGLLDRHTGFQKIQLRSQGESQKPKLAQTLELDC